MSVESSVKCPNCDSYMVSDFCYECGYTTKNYNYIADKLFREEEYERQDRISRAQNAVKSIYKCYIKEDCVHLPISYVDADKTQIRKNLKKINNKYNTNFDFYIERFKW